MADRLSVFQGTLKKKGTSFTSYKLSCFDLDDEKQT